MPLGGVTTVTLTITNPNVTASLSGISVGDNLPFGLAVANPPNIVNTCGGSPTTGASGYFESHWRDGSGQQ